MSQQPDRRPLSLEEWAALPEDEEGEPVDGRLVEEEMPTFIHEHLVRIFLPLFREWLGRGAVVAGSESKLAVSGDRGRKADVAVWLPGSRLPALDASVAHVPPDVAIEIITATPRDARR